MVTRKSRAEIERMRKAGRVVAEVLALVESELKPGVSTGHLDRLAEAHVRAAGAIVDGWHGDGARTFFVGVPPEPVRRLIDVTREAMMAGIAAAVPGNHIEDISAAVEDVAKPHGIGIIRQFVGHGIGTEMHEEPQVPNYRTGRRGRKLEPGLCLAIEPMFTLGDYRAHVLDDDWTVSTIDGSLAAHFEHSIAVTDNGPEILTTI